MDKEKSEISKDAFKPKKKKLKLYHIVLVIIFIIVVIIPLISILTNGNSLNTQDSSTVNSPAQNNTQTSENPSSVKSDQGVSYKKTTINYLVNNYLSLINSDQSQSNFYQITGTIEQKGVFTQIEKTVNINNSSYLLKVGDANNAVLIMLKDNTLSQYNVGDTITVNGVLTSLGSSCSDNSDGQGIIAKICNSFNLNTQNELPALMPLETIVIDTHVSKSYNGNTTAHIVSDTTPPSPVISGVGISYTNAISGLSSYFTMQSFSNNNGNGYSATSTTNSNIDIFLASDGVSVGSASISFMDPNIGYNKDLVTFPSDYSQQRATNSRILSIFINNFFPNWSSASQWINTSLDACKSNNKEVTTTNGLEKITLSCSTDLGSYGIDIKHI